MIMRIIGNSIGMNNNYRVPAQTVHRSELVIKSTMKLTDVRIRSFNPTIFEITLLHL